MYIVKNANLSLRRTKGRNILIGIIMLVIAVAASVTLAIKKSASDLISSYKAKNEIIATLSIDRQKMMEELREEGDVEDRQERREDIFGDIESLSLDQIESFADSSYVSEYYYTNSISIDGSNIDKVSSSTDSNKNGGFGGRAPMMQTSGDFSLEGYSNISAMSDFIDGMYTITSGSVFTDFSGVDCLISEELAEENELEVGDKIKLVSPYDDDLTYILTVSGIYTDNNTSENSFEMFSGSANKIITNTAIIQKIVNDDEDNYSSNYSPTYVLKDEESIEAFKSELTDKGLNEYYSLNTNLDSVTSELKPIQNLDNFSKTFLIVVLIIGGLVLFVLNLINLRERKYEIGVLRTIGMKKVMVITQFCLELFIVAFIAITLGSAVGYFLAPKMSDRLLESEISSLKEESSNIQNNFGIQGSDKDGAPSEFGNRKDNKNIFTRNVEYIDSLETKVDLEVIIKLALIGVGLTIVSSIAALINVSRFSPLKILKERS